MLVIMQMIMSYIGNTPGNWLIWLEVRGQWLGISDQQFPVNEWSIL